MAEPRFGLLGASSFVGQEASRQLRARGLSHVAYSRQARHEPGVDWRQIDAPTAPPPLEGWISLAPIWTLPRLFPLFEATGARRIVALSSTSRFTKEDSGNTGERRLAQSLAEGEEALQAWAESRGVAWTILRPTLIHGYGQDRNIAEIAAFIRRFGFFPVVGDAQGVRQPVHVTDVAGACIAALTKAQPINRCYTLSGRDILTYREMVERIFLALGRPVRIFPVPLGAVRAGLAIMRLLPRYRHLTIAMAERMNKNMSFDHQDAAHDLGFQPRGFDPEPQDTWV